MDVQVQVVRQDQVVLMVQAEVQDQVVRQDQVVLMVQAEVQDQREQLQEIIATTDFPKYGEKYRYYTLTTNRWDLATFQKTGTDIGRFMSGFALKVPSGRTTKRERLRLLDSILDLGLTEDQIHASTTN